MIHIPFTPARENPPIRHRPIHRLGDRSVLVDCADLAEAMALHARLDGEPLPDQEGLVPAATTLLIRFHRPLDAARWAKVSGLLADASGPGAGFEEASASEAGSASGSSGPGTEGQRVAPATSSRVSVPVLYDGADLADCAVALDCSEEAVVARHVRARWRAAFAGFAPGFAYLVQDPGDPQAIQHLTVPRRSTPRTRVPAGSVALAGDQSAVYPQDSPGGWQLIGRTEAVLWDVHRDSPALLAPGRSVSFRAVRDVVELQESRAEQEGAQGAESTGNGGGPGGGESVETEAAGIVEDSGARPTGAEPTGALRVLSPGFSTVLQDPGRPGWEHLGVGPSGWADPQAAQEANRVVGNPPDAVVLEHALGGLALRAEQDAILAVCGARGPLRLVPPAPDRETGRETDREEGRAPLDRPFLLRRGTILRIGPATRGLRFTVAVRGGILAEPVLGSAATDTLSGVGPPALDADALLRTGAVAPSTSVLPAGIPVELPPPPEGGQVLELPMAPGPRADWFAPDSLAALPHRLWRVAADSNRVAARLEPDDASSGPALRRVPAREGTELASEPLVTGSVQIPPSGHPVLFLADRQVTGGYPVIGVLAPEMVRLVAQSPPGTPVRLIPQNLQESPCAPS